MTEPVQGMPATRSYKEADLRPTTKDSQCDPEFPLANYWPVYLGNFWCSPYADHVPKIQEYFGSKGLLVRMVFARSGIDDPFRVEQRWVNCYDFLVYFVSQQDAQDAITYCHREKYHGHRLNVWPGRTPEFFDVSRSVRHSLLQPDRLEIAEQVFEQYIYDHCRARMGCIIKHNKTDLLVEYCSVDDRTMALQYCKLAAPELMSMNKQKQRFLEQNVQNEIMGLIQKTPSFMDMLPPDNTLQALQNGLLPQSTMSWKTLNTVPFIKKIRFIGPGKTCRPLFRRIYRQAKQLFGVDVDIQFHYSEEVRAIQQQMKKEAKKTMSKTVLPSDDSTSE